MDLSDVKTRLATAGVAIKEEKRLANDQGTQLRLSSGQIVNLYDKGTCQVQGKDPGPIRELLGEPGQVGKKGQTGPKTKVFVVYGHDTTAKTQLENLLRKWGLEPLIIDQLPSEGQTIIEKLEHVIDGVDFGVVLATPDDEGHRVGHEDENAYRALVKTPSLN